MPSSSENILHDAVHNAQRLLKYAATGATELDDPTIKTIVESQSLLAADPASPDHYEPQQRFWAAYSKLCKAVSPANAESLQSDAPTPPRLLPVLWAKLTKRSATPGPSQSESASWYAGLIALVVLACVMVLQAYFEVGNSTLAAYRAAEKVLLEKSTTILDADRAIAQAKQNKDSAEEARHTKNRLDAVVERERALLSIDRRLQLVRSMLFWVDWKAKSEDAQDDFARTQTVIAHVEGVLFALRESFLPVTWGLLGAALYVMRALADDIKATAYSTHRRILFGSRYVMGMVSGFVVAKFFPVSIGIQNETVAPFALALVVGYSVEVLFSLLERIINAFTTKK